MWCPDIVGSAWTVSLALHNYKKLYHIKSTKAVCKVSLKIPFSMFFIKHKYTYGTKYVVLISNQS